MASRRLSIWVCMVANRSLKRLDCAWTATLVLLTSSRSLVMQSFVAVSWLEVMLETSVRGRVEGAVDVVAPVRAAA